MHRKTTLPLLAAAALLCAGLMAPAALAAPPTDDAPAAGLWRAALDWLTAGRGAAGWGSVAAASQTGGTSDTGLGLDPDGTGGGEDEEPEPPPPDDPTAPPPPG